MNSDSESKTSTFKRPDGREYVLNIPNEALTNGVVVGSDNPSAPINVWRVSMENKLTKKYYREKSIDLVSKGIK